MLVWPGRVRIAHDDVPTRLRGADTIRYDPVVGEIPAADHVAGAGRGDGRRVHPIKEAVPVAVCHQLGAGLGIGIGIEAIQHLILAIAPWPLPVQVDLVRGHVQKAAHAACIAHALQQVYRAHHVGLVGIAGICIAVPDDGLSRHVNDDLRLRSFESRT